MKFMNFLYDDCEKNLLMIFKQTKPISGNPKTMENHVKYLYLTLIFSLLFGCSNAQVNPAYLAPFAQNAPLIDGIPNEDVWDSAEWRAMDKHMLGEMPTPEDFSGRYKLVWTAQKLYLLAEITDDILHDAHPDPLLNYWDDDALELFIDEDKSGGDHLNNYNAFAYHIALDNQAVDKGPISINQDGTETKNLRTYPDHIKSRWQRSGSAPYNIFWEVEITVYGDDYKDSYSENESPAQPVELTAGKVLGFMLAYCDSDNSSQREHFLGDVVIEPVNGDKNLGYINASVFGELRLVK